MQLKVTPLIYWKSEHTREENEDALAFDTEHGLFAVCDGVGEASFSYQWAPVLARSFIERPILSDHPFEVEHWVREAQAQARPVMTSPETLTGIARTRARQGAAATLLGMVLTPARDRRAWRYGYEVIAIGDSNFYHWRQDPSRPGWYNLLVAFPITQSQDFGSLPDSINSRTFNRDTTTVHRFTPPGDLDLQEGDVLMLSTDAVGQWILRAYESTRENPQAHPVPLLLQLAAAHDAQPESTAWQQHIDNLRQHRAIVNDDSTLIVIRVESMAGGNPVRPFDLRPLVEHRSQELRQAIVAWANGGGQLRGPEADVDIEPDLHTAGRDIDIALAYGDGSRMETSLRARVSGAVQVPAAANRAPVETSHIELWQSNADAYKRVSDAVRAVVRDKANLPQLQDVWSRTRRQLFYLSWTQGLLKTLRDMGVEPQGASDADARANSDPATERVSQGVREAIAAWANGTGDEASIIRACDAAEALNFSLAAAIATPVPVDGSAVSHIDVWKGGRGSLLTPVAAKGRSENPEVLSSPPASAPEVEAPAPAAPYRDQYEYTQPAPQSVPQPRAGGLSGGGLWGTIIGVFLAGLLLGSGITWLLSPGKSPGPGPGPTPTATATSQPQPLTPHPGPSNLTPVATPVITPTIVNSPTPTSTPGLPIFHFPGVKPRGELPVIGYRLFVIDRGNLVIDK